VARRFRAQCWRDVKDILLLDVTPLSLGVETLGRRDDRANPAQYTIPTRKVETYSTAADNQPGVEIHVMQASANSRKTTGRSEHSNWTDSSGPRGTPQIEVHV